MEIGVFGVATDETLRPDEMARLVESAGFDAMAFGEHTHIPVRSDSKYPLGEMPREYMRTFDLFVAMQSALMATTSLRVESSIIQIGQRDPITTAKQAASVDFLSGGRLDLIVGHGWNLTEVRNHGVDPVQRYEVVRERILAMREIWLNDEAEFHGEHVNFDAIYSWPKPAQASGVPLMLAGNSPGAEERALAYADGWATISGPGCSPPASPRSPQRIRACASMWRASRPSRRRSRVRRTRPERAVSRWTSALRSRARPRPSSRRSVAWWMSLWGEGRAAHRVRLDIAPHRWARCTMPPGPGTPGMLWTRGTSAMTVVIDTRTVLPEERFDFWVAGAHNVFFPLRCRRVGDDAGPFSGSVRRHSWGRSR